MPRTTDINHMKQHIKAVMGEFPLDASIQRQGKLMVENLDVAVVDSQGVLDYLDSEMSKVITPDTTRVRGWIAGVKASGEHSILGMARLLEGELRG